MPLIFFLKSPDKLERNKSTNAVLYLIFFSLKRFLFFISPAVDLSAVSGTRGHCGEYWEGSWEFSGDSVSFRANSTLMQVKVRSSTLKLVPSDVVWWFMSKAVLLGVMAGGAVVKWCDGDTSKEGEWGHLRALRCG